MTQARRREIGRPSAATPTAVAGCGIASAPAPDASPTCSVKFALQNHHSYPAGRHDATVSREDAEVHAGLENRSPGASGILAGSPGMPPYAMKTDRTRVVPGRPVGSWDRRANGKQDERRPP